MRFVKGSRRPNLGEIFSENGDFGPLAVFLGNPVAESTGDVHPGAVAPAALVPAVLDVQRKIRCPRGIVLLVKVDGARIRKNRRLFRIARDEPGILPLYGGIVAQDGLVYHERQLVALVAFLGPGLYVQVVVAVADEGDFDIVVRELDGVFLAIVYRVLDVAAALHFPAVVDAAAGKKPE